MVIIKTKNGNLTAHYKGEGFNHHRLCWDEENRLRGVADDHYASIYGYDASGERAIKFTGSNSWIDVNGIPQGFAYLNTMTLYTSPYLVASQKGYTKHYYIENQRIASKLGNGGLQDLNNANQAMTVEEKEKRSAKVKAFKSGLSNTAQCLNLKHFDFVFKTNCPPPPNAAKFEPCLFQYMAVLEETEPDRYFYHPDHLGSSSWITDAGGKPIQHLGYLPFGEEFVDQRTSDWSAAYKFTGKEKDEETGYNYFGARYYMSDIGIWASPDPLSDKYPSTSSYAYCANNPVKLIDPNGMEIGEPDRPFGRSNYEQSKVILKSGSSHGDKKQSSYVNSKSTKDDNNFSTTATNKVEKAVPENSFVTASSYRAESEGDASMLNTNITETTTFSGNSVTNTTSIGMQFNTSAVKVGIEVGTSTNGTSYRAASLSLGPIDIAVSQNNGNFMNSSTAISIGFSRGNVSQGYTAGIKPTGALIMLGAALGVSALKFISTFAY